MFSQGSGLSEGSYVTLGALEVDDLATAVQYLRDEGSTSTIALWGRSMGAVTALLYCQRDPSIAGMVRPASRPAAMYGTRHACLWVLVHGWLHCWWIAHPDSRLLDGWLRSSCLAACTGAEFLTDTANSAQVGSSAG